MKRAIVSLSGGMDSATLLACAIRTLEKENVEAVSFFYNSKHNPLELTCSQKLADHFGVKRREIDLSGFMSSFKSALMDKDWKIPEGHYEEQSMSQTVVPNRNLIFLSVLGGLAVNEKIDEIWLGVHAGDHAIYPDCRPDFISSARLTLKLATGTNLELMAPFLFIKKKDILRVGLEYGVPYEHTRTCYSDEGIACGVCGSCQERLEAWKFLRKEDPLEYKSREILPKKVDVI